jgi:hypothetical protein
VRPWKDLVPKIMSLDQAYRPRKNEEDKVPHSFVFRRRSSHLKDKSLVFQDVAVMIAQRFF